MLTLRNINENKALALPQRDITPRAHPQFRTSGLTSALPAQSLTANQAALHRQAKILP
jgi:hypothetical protein